MKHKVNDKVRIARNLVANETYGADSFEPEMEEFKGQIATIKRVTNDVYTIDLDNGRWNWTDLMFEEVDIVKDDAVKDNTLMTVKDLLNKTDVEKGGLIISIYYPNAYFETTIGHNKINRNSELYRRFIKAYGDMIVDEVSFDIKNDNMIVMRIKVDYAD